MKLSKGKSNCKFFKKNWLDAKINCLIKELKKQTKRVNSYKVKLNTVNSSIN